MAMMMSLEHEPKKGPRICVGGSSNFDTKLNCGYDSHTFSNENAEKMNL